MGSLLKKSKKVLVELVGTVFNEAFEKTNSDAYKNYLSEAIKGVDISYLETTTKIDSLDRKLNFGSIQQDKDFTIRLGFNGKYNLFINSDTQGELRFTNFRAVNDSSIVIAGVPEVFIISAYDSLNEDWVTCTLEDDEYYIYYTNAKGNSYKDNLDKYVKWIHRVV